MHARTPTRRPAGLQQAGLSLIFALLALVALTLGAVALVRSVDTGVLALGNLSQKQASLVAAGRGTEDAVRWLQANMGAALDNDIPASSYYASAMPTLDATGRGANAAMAVNLVRVNWDNDGCQVDGEAFPLSACLNPTQTANYSGVEVKYVIHRLCQNVGAEGPANACAKPITQGDAVSPDRGGCSEGATCEAAAPPAEVGPYYRITTRAKGARGTLTFTETLVNFR